MISWLREERELSDEVVQLLHSHLHPDPETQKHYAEFSENNLSNFFLPLGLAPNFLIDGEWHIVPMATEESSVVAAASHAAKFWSAHGGFHTEIRGQVKTGQVHFYWSGNKIPIRTLFDQRKDELLRSLDPHVASMKKRGGGIVKLELLDRTDLIPDYYQLHGEFLTSEAMGANFINTVLEQLAGSWEKMAREAIEKGTLSGSFETNMAILSNYTPGSLVRVKVESDIQAFGIFDPGLSGEEFAGKFVRATEIARADISRAVTHNKGIFNGIDAVVIATGNDFRAVEACGHAYASRDGKYRGLSTAEITGSIFRMELEIPLSVGTVGGLTNAHPLAKTCLKILGDPGADRLMSLIASAGLANNFSAIRALITSGIQKGHMKMHLSNILVQLGATEKQKQDAVNYFRNKTVTYAEVKKFVQESK